MDETRFGTGHQLPYIALDLSTHLEKVSRYPDPVGQPLERERHIQQEELW